jgi:hypothetical protein
MPIDFDGHCSTVVLLEMRAVVLLLVIMIVAGWWGWLIAMRVAGAYGNDFFAIMEECAEQSST